MILPFTLLPTLQRPPDIGVMFRRVTRETTIPHDVFYVLRSHPNFTRMAVAVADYFTSLLPSSDRKTSLASCCIRNATQDTLESMQRNDPDEMFFKYFVQGLVRNSADSLHWHVSVRKYRKTHVWDPSEEGLRTFWERHQRQPVIRWREERWDTISQQDFRAMLAVKLLNRNDFTRLHGGLRGILEMPV